MLVVQVLCSPHLMLPDAGADNRLALDDLVQALEHEMRLDEVAITIVGERMIAFQRGNMR